MIDRDLMNMMFKRDEKALNKAVKIIGSKYKLAKALGLNPSNVYQWPTRHKRIPAKHVIKIEKLTGGKVTRHELRPDLYPKE